MCCVHIWGRFGPLKVTKLVVDPCIGYFLACQANPAMQHRHDRRQNMPATAKITAA